MARSATTFQKGDKGNPKGRKPKTDVERSAEEFLAERTPHSAERLLACADGAYEDRDWKVAGALYAQHLKFSLGETIRSEVAAVVRSGPLDGVAAEKVAQVLEELREREKPNE